MVEEQQLAIIEDDKYTGKLFIGVLRGIKRLDPILRGNVRIPYVEYHEYWSQAYPEMSYTNVYVSLCSVIDPDNKKIENCRIAPHPNSKVYVMTKGASILNKIEEAIRKTVQEEICVGEQKYSGLKLPLNAYYARCHIGVFGATGMGKSRLVKALVDELVKNYAIIIFDHTGVDYTPFYNVNYVISSKNIEISADVLSSVVLDMARLDRTTYPTYMDVACMVFLKQLKGENVKLEVGRRSLRIDDLTDDPLEKFISVADGVMATLGAKDTTRAKAKLFLSEYMDKTFIDEVVNKRKMSPKEIVQQALKLKGKSPLVINLGDDTEIAVKRGIVYDIISAAWEIVKECRNPLNLGFVIDEAQNYAGEYTYPTNRIVEMTAREGRKWGLFVILASQRVSRDISASIRANINTVFFSKLQATGDLKEISGFLDIGGIEENDLALLESRDFFVAGLMNPLRIPMLLRVKEVS
ncbi:ATP-binding protein [Archaeoglobus sp.]